jgi:CMP-N,N'-diacetyllegionaminic acid synthase
MLIKSDSAIALIPARGGSKSIKLKNIVPLGTKKLIEYQFDAALGTKIGTLDDVYCTTDSTKIADVCHSRNIKVIERPISLAEDLSRVEDAVTHSLHVLFSKFGEIPEIIALLQPTSPFLRPEHIEKVIKKLREHSEMDAVQTVTDIPHNMHAYNQRAISDDGLVSWVFSKERKIAYNKNLKPKHFKFGNLVAFRSKSVLEGKSCFGSRSGAVYIEPSYSVDVDGPEDLEYARFLIEHKKVIFT